MSFFDGVSRDLIVQYVVTAFFLGGALWFAIHYFRDLAQAPDHLHDGDKVSLLKVRHIDNGGHLDRGRALQVSGGLVILGSTHLTLKRAFGVLTTTIEYARISKLRIESFGMSRIFVFEVVGESRYWALWISRNKAAALRDYLVQKGVTVGAA